MTWDTLFNDPSKLPVLQYKSLIVALVAHRFTTDPFRQLVLITLRFVQHQLTALALILKACCNFIIIIITTISRTNVLHENEALWASNDCILMLVNEQFVTDKLGTFVTAAISIPLCLW